MIFQVASATDEIYTLSVCGNRNFKRGQSMKYISTLIFVIALIVSWQLIHEKATINFETHASIQLKMVDVIKQSILEIKPLAENIEILNISTEPLSDQAIKAYFSYKYSEPDEESKEFVEQQIHGDAILRRKNGPNFSEDHWVLENVQTQTGNLTFKNGIVITPKEEDAKNPAEDAENMSPTDENAGTPPSQESIESSPTSSPAPKESIEPSTHPATSHE